MRCCEAADARGLPVLGHLPRHAADGGERRGHAGAAPPRRSSATAGTPAATASTSRSRVAVEPGHRISALVGESVLAPCHHHQAVAHASGLHGNGARRRRGAAGDGGGRRAVRGRGAVASGDRRGDRPLRRPHRGGAPRPLTNERSRPRGAAAREPGTPPIDWALERPRSERDEEHAGDAQRRRRRAPGMDDASLAAPRPHRSPVRARSPSRRSSTARSRPHHRPLQPEGRRRQDDDEHQPRRGARRVRPPGARRRLRPAGRALRGPRRRRPTTSRRSTTCCSSRTQGRRARPSSTPASRASTSSRRTSTCRPPRCTSSTRSPASRSSRGVLRKVADRLRRHPDRLPAVARHPDRQRAHRQPRRAHPARVRVLRAARRRPAHRDDRQGARPAQPGDRARRHPRHHVRLAHAALPRGARAGRRRVRRPRARDGHLAAP